MFPVDSKTNDYDERMLELFNELIEVEKLPWKLQDICQKASLLVNLPEFLPNKVQGCSTPRDNYKQVSRSVRRG